MVYSHFYQSNAVCFCSKRKVEMSEIKQSVMMPKQEDNVSALESYIEPVRAMFPMATGHEFLTYALFE